MKHTNRELPRDPKDLIDLARKQGWEVTKASNGHWRLYSPSGEIVGHSGTPSDYRASKNFRADLKRAGLKPTFVEEKEREMKAEDKPAVETVPEVSETPPPPIAMGAPAMPKKKAPYGQVKNAILNALAKIDRPGGVLPEDILARVMAAAPSIKNATDLSRGIYNLVRSGYVESMGDGKFKLAGTTPITKKKGRGARTEEVDDEKVLEEALAVLAKLEQVIKKYKAKMGQLNQLRQLLGGE